MKPRAQRADFRPDVFSRSVFVQEVSRKKIFLLLGVRQLQIVEPIVNVLLAFASKRLDQILLRQMDQTVDFKTSGCREGPREERLTVLLADLHRELRIDEFEKIANVLRVDDGRILVLVDEKRSVGFESQERLDDRRRLGQNRFVRVKNRF